ncbi:hypothetical protein [Nostoc sp.]|uniref:hypothetical protein n=1 Tax=Nostoc sp. TaxID=1180 RepID=UPI002FFA8D30
MATVPQTGQLVLAGDHTAWSRQRCAYIKRLYLRTSSSTHVWSKTSDTRARLQHDSLDSRRLQEGFPPAGDCEPEGPTPDQAIEVNDPKLGQLFTCVV